MFGKPGKFRWRVNYSSSCLELVVSATHSSSEAKLMILLATCLDIRGGGGIGIYVEVNIYRGGSQACCRCVGWLLRLSERFSIVGGYLSLKICL